MKKILAVLLVITLLSSSFYGCASMDNKALNETPAAVQNPEGENKAGPDKGLSSASYHQPFLDFLKARTVVISPISKFRKSLYDKEFTIALEKLALELKGEIEDEYYGNPSNESYTGISERVLRDHFAPLARAAEKMLEKVTEEASDLDMATMSEQELEAFFESCEPAHTDLSPASEEFLGAFYNKMNGVLIRLAKSKIDIYEDSSIVPIHTLMEKLKALINPLFERIILCALENLPDPLSPRAGDQAGKTLDNTFDDQVAHVPANEYSYEFLQREFDQVLAEIIFANKEDQQDSIVDSYTEEIEKGMANPGNTTPQPATPTPLPSSPLKPGLRKNPR